MRLVSVVLGVALLAATPHVSAQAPADVVDLAPGRPVEREIKGGETQRLRVPLEAGQYLGLAVEQRGADVAVRVLGPDGAPTWVEVDDVALTTPGSESVDVVADAPGAYVVEVRSTADAEAPPGRFEARAEVRPATEREISATKPRRIMAEAGRLAEQKTNDGYLAAIAKANEAIPLFQALGQKRDEALTHSFVGDWSYHSGDLKGSAAANERALALARAVGDRRMEIDHLVYLGVVYRGMGDLDRAAEYLTKALEGCRALGDRAGEAKVLMSLGVIKKVHGDHRTAIALYEQALEIFKAARDWAAVGVSYNNIAISHAALGDFDQILPSYEMALDALEKAHDRRRIANTLAGMADQYKELGEWQKASAAFDGALAIGRDGGDPRFLARTLIPAATYYFSLGEYELAETYATEALELERRTGEKEGEEAALSILAARYSERGERDRSIATYQEVAKANRERGYANGLAEALVSLGREQLLAGRLDEALATCEEGVRIAQASATRGLEWKGLMLRSKVRDKMGDAKGHAEDLARALEIARSSKASEFVVESLEMRVADEIREGRLDEARRDAEEALALEAAGYARNLDTELRQTLLAKRQNDLTRQYVDILMRLDRKRPGNGLAARALEVAENVRGRDLLDTLELAHAEVAKGVDAALLDEERAARRRLVGKQDLVVRLTAANAPGEQVDAAEREVEEARARYRDVWTRIRAASPAYAALRRPEPPTLATLEREALDADTVLLEYSLGDAASYLWVVTSKGVASYDLGPRAPIDAAAARVREVMTARACAVRHESAEERAERVRRADAEYPAAAAELGRLVLGPAGRIAAKRIAVVADGALQLVPFAALPEAATGRPLVVAHEVVSLPSAGALAAQRRQLAGRAAAPKAVAVLADPVFEAGDERLAGVTVDTQADQKQPPGVAQARGAGCGDRAGLARLHGTRAEADAIAALVPASQRLEALGFDANLELVAGEQLRSYRIVHLATHGYAPATRADLAGVVLSLYDRQGHPKDGFLGLYGLYNLDVPAELVVLSGCETAVGSQGDGEGLVGVARGFMYAGARRVVASLWKVDDAPTAELMTRFYGAMLKGKRAPAAALRQAQLEMLRSKDHAAPFYWASFGLYGEWR